MRSDRRRGGKELHLRLAAPREKRSQDEAQALTNGALHLCRTCHRWAHHNPEKARERGWHVSRYENNPGTVPAVTIAGRFILDWEGGGWHLQGVGPNR